MNFCVRIVQICLFSPHDIVRTSLLTKTLAVKFRWGNCSIVFNSKTGFLSPLFSAKYQTIFDSFGAMRLLSPYLPPEKAHPCFHTLNHASIFQTETGDHTIGHGPEFKWNNGELWWRTHLLSLFCFERKKTAIKRREVVVPFRRHLWGRPKDSPGLPPFKSKGCDNSMHMLQFEIKFVKLYHQSPNFMFAHSQHT